MAYTKADEGAHPPSEDRLWQESVLLLFWDDDAGVGGLFRIGHVPNQGTANYWNGLVTADGLRYRADVHDIPLREEDRRTDGLTAGGQAILPGHEAGGRVDFVDADTEAHLELEDFFPMCPGWELGGGGQVEQDMAAAHYHAAGNLTGTVRLGDRTFAINTTYQRDHSWGPRDWEHLRGHRWIPGNAGRDLMFSAALMLGEHDVMTGGYVMRNGEWVGATELDIVVGVEGDNVTARNAQVAWQLKNGETFAIDLEPVNGIMMSNGNCMLSEQFCRFRVRGEDVSGWCALEVSMNHRLHNQPLGLALGSGLPLGFSQASGRIGLNDRVLAG